MKQLLYRRLPLYPRLALIPWLMLALMALVGLFLIPSRGITFGILSSQSSPDSVFPRIITIGSGITSYFTGILSFSLAVFLFLRKPDDRFALWVSFFFAFSFIMAGPLEMIEYLVFGKIGWISVRAQAFLFTAPVLLFLLTFPNGVITPAGSPWFPGRFGYHTRRHASYE